MGVQNTFKLGYVAHVISGGFSTDQLVIINQNIRNKNKIKGG